MRVPVAPYPHQSLLLLVIWMLAILLPWCGTHCVLMCIPTKSNIIVSIFHMFISCISSLIKYLFKSLACSLIKLFGILLQNLSVLSIFWVIYKTSVRIMNWSYFPQVAFLLVFLMISFGKQKLLVLIKSNVHFSFMFSLRNVCLPQSYKSFLLYFSLEI